MNSLQGKGKQLKCELHIPRLNITDLEYYCYYCEMPMKWINKKEDWISNSEICGHCKKPIKIRNLSGYCDHLYFPDNCEVCKKGMEEKKGCER